MLEIKNNLIMDSAIKTENLTKIYPGKNGKKIQALGQLNLDIKQGSTFGFIGPNGAGKTTAIKILIGLTFATSGKAYLFGKPSADPAARRSMGYLSEVAAYSPHLEAQELLSAFGAMCGLGRLEREKRTLELLDLVGLKERRKSRLGEFSKGMLQRFGIAQALLHKPSLLILDEPTSGLDPILQREVLDVLLRLKEQGITIFFSSHRLIEVEGLCDNVGIVSLGNLIFQGTLSQLENQQQQTTPFIIRFQAKDGNVPAAILNKKTRPLGDNKHEVIAEQSSLNQALEYLHDSGLTITSILPQHPPLEDTFIDMIEKHQGKTVTS